MSSNKQEAKYTEFRQDAEGVLAYYEEIKHTHSSNSCEPFYKALGMGAGKNSGATYKPCQASPSDLIADVELTALKSLSPTEHRYFCDMYLNRSIDQGDKHKAIPERKAMRDQIYRKLGQAFTERGIVPLNYYFKAKDLR